MRYILLLPSGSQYSVMKYYLFTWFLFILLCRICPAQYYSTGPDPASIHWRQINTKKFRLIYPASFEKNSQYLANILEMVARSDTHSLSAIVPKIPIIIH